MKYLYFLRHGIAVLRGTPGCPDDDRPLTDEGIDKIARAAKGIKRLVDRFDIILTSPLKRASQTALIVAREMNCEDRVETIRALSQGCTAKGLRAVLSKYKQHEHILLVGHEPDFSSVISALIGASSMPIVMKKGALCKIELSEMPPSETGKIELMLQPKILRMLGKK